MLGAHPIRIYSKTQTVVALSSAESEFYGTVKAATEGIGVLALMKDLGVEKKIQMKVDASAALGVIERKGIGKIRHLETGALWLQEKHLRDLIRFEKTPGADNVADLFTKNVPRETCERHVHNLGCVFEQGRADCAAQLHAIHKKGCEIDELLSQVDYSANVVHDDDMNWSGTEDMSVTELIKYIENEKNMRISVMRGNWAGQVTQDMTESLSGYQCNKCRCNGSPKNWQDHWHVRNDASLRSVVWIRHHTKPRHSLYTPYGSRMGPEDDQQLHGTRTTIGTFSDGRTFSRSDDWRDRDTAHQTLSGSWTGVTVFHAMSHDQA